MSVVERATGNVLDVTSQIRAREVHSEGGNFASVITLDQDHLRSNGLYTTEAQSEQQGLELRAIKRRLLRRIGFLRDSNDRRTRSGSGRLNNLIMVTSSAAGEGKTFSALNLALSFAFEDKIDTLLVDADLHRPMVRNRLGLSSMPGLAQKILDPALDLHDLRVGVDGAPLAIVTEGSRVEKDLSIFSNRDSAAIWLDLAARQPNGLVIVDAPPVLATADAVLLAKYMDEIVFVVESGKTTDAAISSALDELLDVNGKISLLLNRCLLGSGGTHYGSYEYYGKSDGEDD